MSRHRETGWDILFALLHVFLDSLLELAGLLAEHDSRVHVRWGRAFGVVEEGDDAYEDGFDALGRGPALAGGFTGHFVVAGGVKDGDAEFTVGVNVGVEDGPAELKGRRRVWVVCGECHLGFEIATVV